MLSSNGKLDPTPTVPQHLGAAACLLYRFRRESFGFGSPFDTSGRTGLTARAEVSKREHIAELNLRKGNI
jgi:hypothetical protein